MDIAGGHGRARQQRRVYHAVVAVGMIVRNETLVAPEPVHARPRKPRSNVWLSELFIEPLRRRTARTADSEAPCRGERLIGQPLRGVTRKCLGIVKDALLAGHHARSRPAW